MEAYSSYSEFVRRTELKEATNIIEIERNKNAREGISNIN